IHVVVNVGDDTDVWGLHVSPDIDSIQYALAGKLDTTRGWGLVDETFRCLEEMQSLGMPSWFRLGDRDLATHITRTQLLRSGVTWANPTPKIAKSMGVRTGVLPAIDDPVRTKIEPLGGTLGFQNFFAREHGNPAVTAVSYAGASEAHASEAVLQSIRNAH